MDLTIAGDTMKFNPFRPNNMVGPGMFVGRIDELDTIEQCLFQTQNANPQHFLIEGERGIGKSSLLFLTKHIANGTVPSRLINKVMKFLVVDVDLGSVETQLDIVQAIGRRLRTAIGERDGLKRTAARAWEFLLKWEVMGVRYHPENTVATDDARDELVSTFLKLTTDARHELDGIFLIIDEADAPGESAKLGEFLKLFAERLARNDCNNVLLGLAGLPSAIPKMRASHPSAPRLFEVLRLDPLSPDERMSVVSVGLEAAAAANGLETKITGDALNLIADLSEGYPHFIQQFSYSAFAQDQDNVIDVSDVEVGAYKEGGALTQLGHKYFSDMYHGKISSDDYRRVLDTMAAHSDGWTARKDLIAESGIADSRVSNALVALKERNIIVQDESRRGFYRLPTKSFATWINAIRSLKDKQDSGIADLFRNPP